MITAQTGAGNQRATKGARRRLVLTLLALAAGPAAWSGQLIIDYAVASELCFGKGAPRAAPPPSGWAPEHLLLILINLACLAIAVTGGFAALTSWRRTHDDTGAAGYAAAKQARARFLSACAIFSAGIFAVAILFNTASPLLVPSCWRFTS